MGCACSKGKKDEPLLNSGENQQRSSTSFIEAKAVSTNNNPFLKVDYAPPKVNESSVNRLSLPFSPSQREISAFVNKSNFTHPIKVVVRTN